MYTCCVERINYEDFLDSEFTHTLELLCLVGPVTLDQLGANRWRSVYPEH